MSGKKKIELSVTEIERLAGLGFTQNEICLRLGISDETLRRRKLENVDIVEAIKRGRAEANDKVSSKLMTLINKGNLGAIIWYEKTRRGLTDKVEVTTWRDKVILGLRSGELDPQDVQQELGVDLAKELFTSAGLLVAKGGEIITQADSQTDKQSTSDS